MEIILVRHGKPEAATNPKLTASGFARWVRNYKNSSLTKESLPPKELGKLVNSHYLISSDLKRAIQSAKRCTGKQPCIQLKSLREMDIPRYKFPLKLKANTWLYLNRIVWILGLNGSTESFKQGKQRAKLASEQLEALVKEQNSVVAFGHGYINIHIKRKLMKKGWVLDDKSNDYWGVTRLKSSELSEVR